MLTVSDAFNVILGQVQPLSPLEDREIVSLDRAMGRILAREVRGAVDFPYWDNSAMDGYAIASQDSEAWSWESPLSLDVVMEISAGVVPGQSLGAGQAARIFTGAMLPDGADTIVMQEKTERISETQVQILEKPQPQAFVRHRGSYYQAGDSLLAAGLKLGATDLAVLATMQCCEVPVFRQPVVAIVSTGNELVAPDQLLQPGQIVDSNRYVLSALIQQAGAIALHFQPVGDRLADVKQAIADAMDQADLVISTGGVSVGDYDFVDQALKELGGQIQFESVAVKPGKPLTFATFEDPSRRVLYFGLPGNPVSAPVGFWRFVQPALLKFAGLKSGYEPTFVQARSLEALSSNGQRETYVWGHLSWGQDGAEFRPAAGHQISGNLINLSQTTGLGVLSCDRPSVAEGDLISVMLI